MELDVEDIEVLPGKPRNRHHKTLAEKEEEGWIIMEAEKTDEVFVVMVDTRIDGQVVYEIDSIWADIESAVNRRKKINEDPRRFVNMVANVENYYLNGGRVNMPSKAEANYKRRTGGRRIFADEQIIDIRHRYNNGAGESLQKLADEYGVSRQMIHNITSYKSYAEID